ncbi:hypothetical protein AB0M50_32180, partial [Nonomuraea fuscirosea]|uniref:hypothetical protein n=1 Tax=Nonomuraea fuscirosea TaxID=1291556 RepID=UPI00344258A5
RSSRVGEQFVALLEHLDGHEKECCATVGSWMPPVILVFILVAVLHWVAWIAEAPRRPSGAACTPV